MHKMRNKNVHQFQRMSVRKKSNNLEKRPSIFLSLRDIFTYQVINIQTVTFQTG